MIDIIKHIIHTAKVTIALAVSVSVALSCDKVQTKTPEHNPDLPEEPAAFKIKVSDITTWSTKLEITPLDGTVPYYYGVISKKDYEALKTDEALINSSIEHLQEVASLYGTDYTAIAKSKSSAGAVSVVKDGLASETDYFAYAFAFNDDYLGGNSLVKTAFHTETVQRVECSFSIDITNVGAASAIISVNPTNNECYYFCDFVTAEEYDKYGGDDGIIQANAELIRSAIQIYEMAGYDKSVTDFLEKGNYRYECTKLEAETDYVVFAFGMDPSCKGTTDVTKKTFTTTSEGQSSLTFTSDLYDLKFNGARIAFSPSNDEETFFTDCMDYETFSGFKSDKELTDWAIAEAGNSMSSLLSKGYHVVDASGLLVSKTKYVAYAFGFNGSSATTSVTKVEFTTPEMPTGSSASVSISYETVDAGIYNPSYEGKKAVKLTIEPSVSAQHWFVGTYSSLDGYSDYDTIEGLQMKGYKDKKELAFIKEDGKQYTVAAVAVDPSGIAGPLVKIPIK